MPSLPPLPPLPPLFSRRDRDRAAAATVPLHPLEGEREGKQQTRQGPTTRPVSGQGSSQRPPQRVQPHDQPPEQPQQHRTRPDTTQQGPTQQSRGLIRSPFPLGEEERTKPRQIVLLCGSAAAAAFLLQRDVAPYLRAIGARPVGGWQGSGRRWVAPDGSRIRLESARGDVVLWARRLADAIVVPLYRQDVSLGPGERARVDAMLAALEAQGRIHVLQRIQLALPMPESY